MLTIRRAYFYAVAFVSFQVLLWTAVGLGKMIVPPPPVGRFQATRLAGLLSALIVAVPFYVLHWRHVQRQVLSTPDERSTSLRAAYLYLLMAVTAISALVSSVQFISELVEMVLGPAQVSLLPGPGSPLSSLVTPVMTTIAWLYVRTHARSDDHEIEEPGDRATIRRAYRYLMTCFTLALASLGTIQLLDLILSPVSTAGSTFRQLQLTAGLAPVVVGFPSWFVSWRSIQTAIAASHETPGTTIRRIYLYLASLVGLLGSIVSAASVLSHLLRRLFGETFSGIPLSAELARPLAVLPVCLVLWGYHSKVLARDTADHPLDPRQATVRRLYLYILCFLGLGATITASLILTTVLRDALSQAPLGALRVTLSNGLATLAAGLPLWLVVWLSVQKNALREDERGEAARRSLVRRAYLYLFAFVGAIGILVASVVLIDLILKMLLAVPPGSPLAIAIHALTTLAIFTSVLTYHLVAIRGDFARQQLSRTEALAAFPVSLIGSPSWSTEFTEHLKRRLPGLPVHCFEVNEAKQALTESQAVVIASNILTAGEAGLEPLLADYPGLRVVVPVAQPGWKWSGVREDRPLWRRAQETTRLLEQAAIGETPFPRHSLGPWGIVGVIMAVLFALLILLPATLGIILSLTGTID